MAADDTTPEIPDVEPAYVFEPWPIAVDAVCSALETYAAWRLVSGDIPGCAHAAGITDATAARFERTLDAISDDEDTETDAAPGRPGPGAADNQAPTK